MPIEDLPRILPCVELLRKVLEGVPRNVGVELPDIEVPQPLSVLQRVLAQDVHAVHVHVPVHLQ